MSLSHKCNLLDELHTLYFDNWFNEARAHQNENNKIKTKFHYLFHFR